jgi:hypothetical protein
MNIENEHEQNRALFFLSRQNIVHVKKKDGLFLNGLILEVGTDFFIIKDRLGKEYMIFFAELEKPLEVFHEREGEENDL